MFRKLKNKDIYLIFFSLFSSIPQIYEEFYHTINNADREKDLKWWSNNHGVNMAMNWPDFEVSLGLGVMFLCAVAVFKRFSSQVQILIPLKPGRCKSHFFF